MREVEQLKRMNDYAESNIKSLELEKSEWEHEKQVLSDEKEKLLIQLQTGIDVNLEE